MTEQPYPYKCLGRTILSFYERDGVTKPRYTDPVSETLRLFPEKRDTYYPMFPEDLC